jgi:hypothetical protein
MKKTELKQLIREEIKKTLNENLENSLKNKGFEVYPEEAWIVRNSKTGSDFIVFTEGEDYRSIKLAGNLPGAVLGEDIEDFIDQFTQMNSKR